MSRVAPVCYVYAKHYSFNSYYYSKFQVTQAIGYSVELVCHVEAYPRPTITWVHQGIQLSSNQVFYFKSSVLLRKFVVTLHFQ